MEAREYLDRLIRHRLAWVRELDEPEGADATVVAQVAAAADALVAVRAIDRLQADEIESECQAQLRSLGLLQVYSATMEAEMTFGSATRDAGVFGAAEASQEDRLIEPIRIIPMLEELGSLSGCRVVILGFDVWSDQFHLRLAQEISPRILSVRGRAPSVLVDHRWEAHDDVGTPYYTTGGGGHGGPPWVTLMQHFKPAIPKDATVLSVRARSLKGDEQIYRDLSIPGAGMGLIS